MSCSALAERFDEMHTAMRGALWFGAYVAVVVVPLIFATLGVVDAERGFWREFAVAIGFVGLSMMGMQFVLVARLKVVAAPFGEDVLVMFHRYMGYLGTALIFAHPVILIVLVDHTYLERVIPWTAPWAGRLGTLSIVCVLIVIATSIWRNRLKISYEVWQVVHLVLSTVAIAAAVGHVELIGNYISEPWKRALWVLMSLGFIIIFLWVRIVRPTIRMRRPWEITAVTAERGDVYTITLRPVGHDGFTFAPGQFGWLSLHRSPFSPTQHPFSFSSNGDDPSAVQMSIKELGDFTRTICQVTPGTRAYLDGPHGVFTPDRYPSPGVVLIGGGVGITPLMSILRTFAERRDTRPCYLFFGIPDITSATFADEIDALTKDLNLTVIYVASRPSDDWTGERGFINADVLLRHLPDNRKSLQYFICGPGPLQDAMEDALGDLNVPREQVHTERFNFV